MLLGGSFSGAEGLDGLHSAAKAANEEVALMVSAAVNKKVEMSKKYVTALNALEKTLAANGELDVIIRLREERESVDKTGSTTAHQDKQIVALREKYLKGLAVIEEETKAVRIKAAAAFSKKAQEAEKALTKALKVDEALALRKEAERLSVEIAGGTATEQPLAANPFENLAEMTTLKPLKPIPMPVENPPVVDKPFAIKGPWLTSLTIPAGKYKMKERALIGDRGKQAWVTIVLAPGSTLTGSEKAPLDMSAGKFVSSKSRFDRMQLTADLACAYFFQSCAFVDCEFIRGGVWSGGVPAARFYFDGCLIKGDFAHTLNTDDYGLRVQNSVFEEVTLPSMHYRKLQPGSLVNSSSFRVANCRFVKCKVPTSFLLLTRDCVFENCTLMDDPKKPSGDDEITQAIEVPLYLKASRVTFASLPPKVSFPQKAEIDLKGVTIPTSASLASLLAPAP